MPPLDRRLVKKGSKIRSRSAPGIPLPSSAIRISIASDDWRTSIVTVLAPAWRLFSMIVSRSHHEDHAAALYTRIAFEQSLKKFCDENGVRVRYRSNQKQLTAEELLIGLEKWIDEKPLERAALKPLIDGARRMRSVVLNPYSHSTPVTLTRNEVEAAIGAVELLHSALFPPKPPKEPAIAA